MYVSRINVVENKGEKDEEENGNDL